MTRSEHDINKPMYPMQRHCPRCGSQVHTGEPCPHCATADRVTNEIKLKRRENVLLPDEVGMLKGQLEAKEQLLSEANERIAELADAVQTRDEEIATLNAGIERLRNRKCEMSVGPSVDERLQAQRETIERLRAELAAVKEDLDAEHSVSDAYSKELEQLRAELAQLLKIQRECGDHQACAEYDLEVLRAELANTTDTIEEQAQLREGLEAEAADTIERLRAELDELDNVQAAALIRQENERLRAELAELKDKFCEVCLERDRLQAHPMWDELKRREAERDEARAELAQVEAHNATYARRWGDAIKERDEARALCRRYHTQYLSDAQRLWHESEHPWLEEASDE